MPLGERIKALRKQAGWSQGELAERVSTDASQISRYENGRITPSLDALARIAQALDVSLDHLVFDDIARRPLHTATTPSATASPPSENSPPTNSPSSAASSTASSPKADSAPSPPTSADGDQRRGICPSLKLRRRDRKL